MVKCFDFKFVQKLKVNRITFPNLNLKVQIANSNRINSECYYMAFGFDSRVYEHNPSDK